MNIKSIALLLEEQVFANITSSLKGSMAGRRTLGSVKARLTTTQNNNDNNDDENNNVNDNDSLLHFLCERLHV